MIKIALLAGQSRIIFPCTPDNTNWSSFQHTIYIKYLTMENVQHNICKISELGINSYLHLLYTQICTESLMQPLLDNGTMD
jgi:hypothetical protein